MHPMFQDAEIRPIVHLSPLAARLSGEQFGRRGLFLPRPACGERFSILADQSSSHHACEQLSHGIARLARFQTGVAFGQHSPERSMTRGFRHCAFVS